MGKRAIFCVIAATLMIGGCLVGFAAKAEAKAEFEWNLATWGSSRAMSKPIEWWAKEMEKRTNGRFKVNFGWGATLAAQNKILQGVQTGLFELGHIWTDLYLAELPLHSVTGLPFLGPKNMREECHLTFALEQFAPLKKELEKYNQYFLIPMSQPPHELMGNKVFAKVEDLKGMRLRSSPYHMEVFDKFGAKCSFIPTQDIYSTLERGGIDLIGFPWTYCFGAYRIHEVSKYATLGTHISPSYCFISVNKKAWDKLPADIKAIHDEVSKGLAEVGAEVMGKADRKWLPVFKKAGIQFTTLPDQEYAKLVEAAGPVREKWIKKLEAKGLPAKKALAYYLNLKDRVEAGEIPYR
jgi:TRAP-type C4-dicarboxylate transport system substrate-binding protein